MARKKVLLPVPVESILKRYETGEELADIAKSIGIAERTLYRRLIEHKDKWLAAQEGQALQRYEVAKTNHSKAIGALEALKRQLDEEKIVDAAERKWRLAHVVAIAAAFEKALNRAEWELERLVSRLYGQKQEVRHVNQPILNITVAASPQVALQQGNVIDVVPTQPLPSNE